MQEHLTSQVRVEASYQILFASVFLLPHPANRQQIQQRVYKTRGPPTSREMGRHSETDVLRCRAREPGGLGPIWRPANPLGNPRESRAPLGGGPPVGNRARCEHAGSRRDRWKSARGRAQLVRSVPSMKMPATVFVWRQDTQPASYVISKRCFCLRSSKPMNFRKGWG